MCAVCKDDSPREVDEGSATNIVCRPCFIPILATVVTTREMSVLPLDSQRTSITYVAAHLLDCLVTVQTSTDKQIDWVGSSGK